MERLRVLVTGGAGFIGSHVTEQLIAEGHEVRVLDNLSTGRRENLRAHERLEFVHGDITNSEVVQEAVQGQDAIIHLAAIASVEASVRDPLRVHRVNLEGTVRLLEAAKLADATRFVYASSAAVYGDAPTQPVREDSSKSPLSPYAADKLAGEHYLAHYHRQGWLQGIAFRFFNVFGPRQDPNSPYSGVISIFSKQAANGSTVTIHGDGSQTRDFIFVKDVAAVVVAALAFDRETELPVLNLGRGEEVSLLQLLSFIERMAGNNTQRRFDHSRPGDVYRSCADTARLRMNLPALRFTPLKDGLSATLSAARAARSTELGP